PNRRILRSTTIPIRNKNRLIGLVCLNMDINRIVQTEEFLKPFVHFEDQKISNGDLEKSGTTLLSNLKDQIFEEAILKVETKGEIPQKEKNKFLVKDLYQKDFFALKDSVEFVAKKLGVSIFTIYNYIRELKNEKGGKGGEKHNRKNS
ncbi:MAG: helix-turn-helix domain-containing protein, partial [Caldiserica bacterium]|nr:helix-turn-helix domain-containing protein [Caldisericota bacterium]